MTKNYLKKYIQSKMDESFTRKINTFVRAHTKTELVTMCKQKNVSSNGTKHDLALRILEVKTESFPKKKTVEEDKDSLILRIVKNAHGNYVHEKTLMVFDPNTKRVMGVQNKNGSIRPLNRNDIDICQKHKFQYVIPDLLDPSPIFEILENSDNENDENHNSDFSDCDTNSEDDNESFEN